MNSQAATEVQSNEDPKSMGSELAVLHIQGTKNYGVLVNLSDLWRYRELLYFFTLRDLKLRYKQTALGASWTILQPLLASGVFTILFAKVAKLPSDGVPYPLFCLAGLIPWNYFANSVVRASTSVVGNSNLIGKVYFPRFLIPFSSLLPGLVDFAVAQTVLFPLMLYYHLTPQFLSLVGVPLLLSIAFLFALGAGLWLSAINVRYRDVGNILPFMMQLWMFATPIIYPTSMVPEQYRWILALNPLTGVINGFRSVLLGSRWDLQGLITSLVVTGVVLITGALYFRRVEKSFADSV